MKTCSRCRKTDAETPFSNSQKYYCKECIRYYNRKWANNNGIKEKFIPIVTDTHKQCVICKELKLLKDYSNSTRGRLGKSAYCKPCASIYQMSRVSQEDRRLKTRKYRDSNREWWRSLHRMNQFNRNSKTKAQSDSTVTKEFVDITYNIEICYYCNKDTPREFRTLEHKQPLNKGGLHSASNIVMACTNCNNTKRDMTEEEFKNYKTIILIDNE